MSVSEAIIYSQIVYRSLCKAVGVFGEKKGDGPFAMKKKTFSIEDYKCEGGWSIPIGCDVSRSLAKEYGISDKQYYRIMKSLKDGGYISDSGVKITEGVAKSFFELRVASGLSGIALIVFSYLFNKASKYRFVKKTNDSIARELGTDKFYVSKILKSLISLGFISRSYEDKRPKYEVNFFHSILPGANKPIEQPEKKTRPSAPKTMPPKRRFDDEDGEYDERSYSIQEVIANLTNSFFPN